MVVPHLVLVTAIASVWLPHIPSFAGVRLPPWVVLFCAALALATYSGIVTASGWISTIFLIVLLGVAKKLNKAGYRILGSVFEAVSIAMLFGFAIQLFPGFVGTTIVSPVQVSINATPMRLIARFDVGMAALFLVALYCQRVRSFEELRAIALPISVIGIITSSAVITCALAAGYIRFDLKWPPFALVHLVKTLLITAVVEEAFFRGILQDRLARLSFFEKNRFRRAIPIGISALLFGLVHFPGGQLLVVMATLAGLGYALAYAATKRIEAPIAVHFFVNATHFIAFTYPNIAATS
jgi:membrane protease YdiL (CAAX protease family)